MAIKKHLPTLPNYLEKRRKAAANRLPKHLRPIPVWPLWGQLLLNSAIITALVTLMLNRDDYMTDAAPAITMIICLLLTIFTLVEGVAFKRRYKKIRGERLARLNLGLALLVMLTWAATVAVYIP